MTLIDQIRDLIAEGETERSLDELYKYVKENNADVIDTLVMLRNRMRGIQDEVIRGTMDSQTAALERAKVNDAILKILPQLTPEYMAQAGMWKQAAATAAAPARTAAPAVSSGNKIKWLLMGGGAVLLLIILIASLSGGGGAQEERFDDTEMPADEQGFTEQGDYLDVQLAGLTWMAVNLDEPVEGESICYGEDDLKCEKTGRLYTLNGARQACAALGKGWRLPTYEDWANLTRLYGGAYGDGSNDGVAAFRALSAQGNTGFNAEFGGKLIYSPEDGYFHFYDYETIGHYWADGTPSDRPDEGLVYTFRAQGLLLIESIPKTDYISCRCVR